MDVFHTHSHYCLRLTVLSLKKEKEKKETFTLRESYYPGDLAFDPLGLKPSDPAKFAAMQSKELSNGRLAMIAAAGMCVQEQINGQGILENLGF